MKLTETQKELLYIKQWGEKFGWDAVKGLIDARLNALERKVKK